MLILNSLLITFRRLHADHVDVQAEEILLDEQAMLSKFRIFPTELPLVSVISGFSFVKNGINGSIQHW